jgi:hypothetical protein
MNAGDFWTQLNIDRREILTIKHKTKRKTTYPDEKSCLLFGFRLENGKSKKTGKTGKCKCKHNLKKFYRHGGCSAVDSRVFCVSNSCCREIFEKVQKKSKRSKNDKFVILC